MDAMEAAAALLAGQIATNAALQRMLKDASDRTGITYDLNPTVVVTQEDRIQALARIQWLAS